jgi:hypothetical protein
MVSENIGQELIAGRFCPSMSGMTGRPLSQWRGASLAKIVVDGGGVSGTLYLHSRLVDVGDREGRWPFQRGPVIDPIDKGLIVSKTTRPGSDSGIVFR